MLKPPNPNMKDFARTHLNNILEPWAIQHIEPALAGDADAAQSLVFCANNNKRGAIALLFYLADVKKDAYRTALLDVWEHDHRHLLGALGYNRDPLWLVRIKLNQLFRHAECSLPPELPETLTIWRGTSALSRQKAANGFSWTTDRDTACWFAMRFAKKNGKPLVLKAEIPKAQILCFTDERDESEIVIADQLRTRIDGDPADWTEGHDRYQARKEEANQRIFNRMPAAA